MIEYGRGPAVGAVAGFAIGGESGGLVIGICGIIIIVLVAGKTFGRCTGIPARVTIDTIQERMGSGYGELSLAVIENSRVPAVGGMALGAIVAEIIGDVVGIVGAEIILLVTGPAIGRRSGITLGMAFHTIQGGMSSRKRELGLIVIERRRGPAGGGMAQGTILTEIVGGMIGIVHAVVIILVARPAVRRGAGELPVHMASGTIDGQVLASQRKTSKVMIESRRTPSVLVMALRAVLRETGVDMAGIGDGVIIVLVTSDTFAGKIILAVGVAVDATEGGMNPHKFESAGLHVIEGRPGPGHLVMTGLAIGGKSQGNVRGHLHEVIIVFMAAET